MLLHHQRQIVCYGHQPGDPPATGLELRVAGQGKSALDCVLGQFEHRKHELDLRDSMALFQTMHYGGYYDI